VVRICLEMPVSLATTALPLDLGVIRTQFSLPFMVDGNDLKHHAWKGGAQFAYAACIRSGASSLNRARAQKRVLCDCDKYRGLKVTEDT
jgi:hypothetical protein